MAALSYEEEIKWPSIAGESIIDEQCEKRLGTWGVIETQYDEFG
jgi:hypothetical protein